MPILFQLQFTTVSVIWLLFSLLLGVGYAFWLYRNSSNLNPGLVKVLFAIRAISVSLITFLLFAPLIRFSERILEKPLVFVLQDNSASVKMVQPAGFRLDGYTRKLDALIKKLSDSYDVRTLVFGGKTSPDFRLTFSDKITDINSAFNYINSHFGHRNIGAVILSSDGLYNRGANPLYSSRNLNAPVFSIGLGDTIPRKDLLVAAINYNGIVYLGNDFQIEVNLEAFESKGERSNLTVSGKEGVLFTKSISFNSDLFRKSVPLTLPARQKGLQKFTVSIGSIEGESIKNNNVRDFFVEVLEGRRKIYVLANSPHPDIGVLKRSIEHNKNYEVKAGYPFSYDQEELKNADLLILHQLPSAKFSNDKLQPLIRDKSLWFILGAQSDVVAFSSLQPVLQITGSGVTEETLASYEKEFYDFSVSDSTLYKMKDFPPLIAPAGTYKLQSPASVLFKQYIGRVDTRKPLFLFSNSESNRTAILAGEGLWRWQLTDFKNNGNHQAIQEIIGKTVQLLSTNTDKRRFRVTPSKNTFTEDEPVSLSAELYDKTYKLTNSPDVSIEVKSERERFPYLFSRTAQSYLLDAGTLPAGEYTYTANTRLGTEKFQASGKFIVQQQYAEFQNSVANHQLLYSISKESGGSFLSPDQINTIPDLIKRNEYVKTISIENDTYTNLINIKALFFLILVLLGIEWVSRKRNGVI